MRQYFAKLVRSLALSASGRVLPSADLALRSSSARGFRALRTEQPISPLRPLWLQFRQCPNSSESASNGSAVNRDRFGPASARPAASWQSRRPCKPSHRRLPIRGRIHRGSWLCLAWRSASSSAGNHGLSRQFACTTIASGIRCALKNSSTGSRLNRGFQLNHSSESLRIVGRNSCNDLALRLCASSTRTPVAFH